MPYNGSALTASPAGFYGGDVRLRDSVLSRKRIACFAGLKYLVSLLFSELCHWMRVTKRHPVFMRGVSKIVSGCPEEKMVRIHTGRVVALVANKHAFWDFPNELFVGKPVGKNRFVPLYCDNPIPPFMGAACPFPASGFSHSVSGAKGVVCGKNGMRPKCPLPTKPVVMGLTKPSGKRWLAAFSTFNLSSSKRHGHIISLEAGGYNFAF